MERLLGEILDRIVPWLIYRILPDKAKHHRKKTLKRLLESDRFPQGRSLDVLMRKTGLGKRDCRLLLSEIGAEGIKLSDCSEGRNLSTTLRHRWLEITEQGVLSQPRPAG